MNNIRIDSVKMNQEVETTQLNQPVRDTNVPHLGVGIKQELDDETKHNIQSQLPFLADKIKQEQLCMERVSRDSTSEPSANLIYSDGEELDEKSEEITSFEDFHMKIRKVDSFDERMTELEKVEQSELCGEAVGRHIKNERCVSTWSYFSNDHADVEKKNNSDSGRHSQLVEHDVSEKLPEVNRKTEKNTGDVGEGLERLLVHVRQIVKNTGDIVDDLGRLPQYIHFEKNPRDEVGNFEKMQVKIENTIMTTESKTGDQDLTSRDQKLNESVNIRECPVILEDIMAKITQNDGSLSLNKRDCSKLLDNTICVSNKDTKHSVSSAGSDKLSSNNVCGIGFITFGSLSIHKRKHTREKPYKCDICGLGFTNASYLNAHKIIHTGNKPYKCDICCKGFTNTSYFNAHKMTHTGEKPYKCDVCCKGFTNANYLNAHKMIHTGETPYNCDVCAKGFTKRSNLYVHKRKHTGEKPYTCDVCGKGFTYISNFNGHKQIHTGEKPFKCDVCGKGFTKTSDLYVHKRLHTGEKPYKCDVCCKCFTHNNSLNAHKTVHTGEKPYKCDICGVCFAHTSNLNVHKRIHTGEKPFKCGVCGKGFTRNSNLNSHKKVHL